MIFAGLNTKKIMEGLVGQPSLLHPIKEVVCIPMPCLITQVIRNGKQTIHWLLPAILGGKQKILMFRMKCLMRKYNFVLSLPEALL